MIEKLKYLLSKRDKQFLLFLLFFSIVISIVETVGISAIMPFISVANDFTLIDTNEYYHTAYNLFSFSSKIDFVISFGVVLIVFYIFRSAINLFYFYMLSRFSKGRYHLFAYRLFENYLGMRYRDFIERSSSDLNKAIINEAQNLTTLLSAILFMFSEVFIVILIYSMMIYVNWKITILLTCLLVLNAIFLVRIISPKIKKAGSARESFQKRFYEIINSSFGNFKIMKLKSNNKEIMEKFAEASYGYARTNIINDTYSHFPRLFLEAVGFSIVTFIVIYLVYKYQSDVSNAIALISMFVLGLYRLMPSANRILTSYNQILFYRKSLDIIHNDVIYDTESLGIDVIEFNESIELKDISFEYIHDKPILKEINLTISKGTSIAFIGESGSGKSTLVDLIIGLYKPSSGEICVDKKMLNESNIKSWRSKIGYIPQNVYLFDGTVAQNVAFGNEVDEKKVQEVLKQANIFDFLELHQDGIDTIVGEGGIKLSGGQKQRIAIARALYNDPELLVLDEATSALDNETEAKIMDEIYAISSNKTLIVIAHRLSTIDRCDVVYKLNNGTLVS
ncbi:ATP-binding cassette domain-containing protein [Sulfurospirillum sp. 1307]